MNQPLPVNCPVEPEDRDRSPVAARGPRQEPGKITEVLVLARPLRAGTARGPNPTKEFDGRSRQLKVNANGPKPKAILPEAPGVKKAITHDYRVCLNRDLCARHQLRLGPCLPNSHPRTPQLAPR